jgi:hypothetical protein
MQCIFVHPRGNFAISEHNFFISHPVLVKGCLNVRACLRIAVFCVRFPAQDGWQFNFQTILL